MLPGVTGLKGPFSCLNNARYGIAWGAMGAAEFCWHAARQYTLDRTMFGKPLAQTQLIQKKLADMQTEITLGLHGALQARPAKRRRYGRPGSHLADEAQQLRQGAWTSPAPLGATCMAATVSPMSIHVIRHVMNLEAVNTYEGTHDVHALILGRAQTGLNAFF